MKSNFWILSFVLFSLPASANQNITWTEIEGVKWSNVLEGTYANCIPEEKGGDGNWVRCKKNRMGDYLNAIRDGQEVYVEEQPFEVVIDEFAFDWYLIEKSEAVDACKAIGGRLPTIVELEKFRFNTHFLNLPGTRDHWFWSSSAGLKGAQGFSVKGYTGFIAGDNRRRKNAVRCIQIEQQVFVDGKN